MVSSDSNGECRDNNCGCGPPTRRDFVKLAGLAATSAVAAVGRMPVMAGPFDGDNEYLRTIPTDKKLAPAWVASLTARGNKEVVTDPAALAHVGMPVGGLFAGTVYLGGDGRLWLWDIFNGDPEGISPRTVSYRGGRFGPRDGANYVEPAEPNSPFEQGFAIRVGSDWHRLDRSGFDRVAFDGRYPVGRVSYRGEGCPVRVELEAFSPFIPLEVDDSSLPAVVTSYTITNESNEAVDGELRGWLANPVGLDSVAEAEGRRRNRIVRDPGLTLLVASAEPAEAEDSSRRPDVVFADFESDRYDGWTADGTAFGAGPVEIARIPDYQGKVGGQGRRVVNSHASAPGGTIQQKDAQTGTLTSREFTIERKYLTFLIGGGSHRGRTCLELLVDGQVVASATGRDANRMQPAAWDVRRFHGKTARLRIADRDTGAWGNIGVDQVVFTDAPPKGWLPLAERPDFGTMALAVIDPQGEALASTRLDDPTTAWPANHTKDSDGPLGGRMLGGVGRPFRLEPGASITCAFLLAWHFPNFRGRGVGGRKVGHRYAARFESAPEVARYVAAEFDRLAGDTRRWVETWYDSTLPYWFLDRTMANTSTLATTTCYRFADGRFWAWEGVGCCEGTCTHVWQYAQAPGRLFPEIERITRERVDFGLALHPDGGIGMRASLDGANEPADDGQCGRILGAYREHQMSADDGFLRRVWPHVKAAIAHMIARDGDGDGLLEGPQANTLDAAWFGKISWISSLYLAALAAGAAMADEMGDAAFARRCRTIAEKGKRSMLSLYNGEYFIQRMDPAHPEAIGTGPGCHIDQVFGQTWAHWLGLGRLFDRQSQLSALRALWRYNFVPDVGPFRDKFPRGRWYATAGDAGLLMCTWPKGGQDPRAKDHWQYMYFNECMSGFEWQVAAHMIWEGLDQPDLIEHGLAVARAIHDRYSARLRNPYNEVECSDHYARAMASFGAYQAACGYEYHGPRGSLAFAPRLSPDDFRAAFTAAEGWGRFAQSRTDRGMTASIRLDHGTLWLRSLGLRPRAAGTVRSVHLEIDNKPLAAAFDRRDDRIVVRPASPLRLETRQVLKVTLDV